MAENNNMTQTQLETKHGPTLPDHYKQHHQEDRNNKVPIDHDRVSKEKRNNPPVTKPLTTKRTEKVKITVKYKKRSTVLFTATIFLVTNGKVKHAARVKQLLARIQRVDTHFFIAPYEDKKLAEITQPE